MVIRATRVYSIDSVRNISKSVYRFNYNEIGSCWRDDVSVEDIIIWGEENLEGYFDYDYNGWMFEVEEDAVLFKLTYTVGG